MSLGYHSVHFCYPPIGINAIQYRLSSRYSGILLVVQREPHVPHFESSVNTFACPEECSKVPIINERPHLPIEHPSPLHELMETNVK